MRILFSFVGLLIVLAIIGITVKKQLNSLAPPAAEPAATAPVNDTTPIPSPAGTPRQQVQQVQSDVQRALEQGAARASAAEQ